jgi:DNA polymerase-1
MTTMTPEKKLFLLDAMALIYRAHFAFIRTPRLTSKGLNTSAVFGFMNTLLDVLEKEKPTHIGVAYDTAEPTFRHIQYTEYKANRQQQPEDITVALPYTRKLLEAMHIPLLVKPGFEADDLIGTLASKASQQGFAVYMMTPDKDYGQLVHDHVFIYKPGTGGKPHEVWGVKEVLQRWGIKRVSQVIDILGLMGDSSDNIPGIPGIGEKTAQKLIEEYDSLENLIANTDKLSGKLQANLIQFSQQGLLSKQLATIDTNVPVEFEEENLRLTEYDKAALSVLLEELEFRTIRQRLFKEEAPKTVSVSQKNLAGGQMDLFAHDPDKQAIIQHQIQEINEVFGGGSQVRFLCPLKRIFLRLLLIPSIRYCTAITW